MTGSIHDETGVQRFNQPVPCGLPLYSDTCRSCKPLPQFGQSEGLSLAPTEILLRRIWVPKSINTCAGRNALLIRKKCSCEREGCETTTGNERQAANTRFVQPY